MLIAIDTNNRYVRFFLWFVLIVYMLVLIKFVLFKKSPGYIKDHLLHHYTIRENSQTINFKPFHTIKMYLADNMPRKQAFVNLMGNFAGFIPLGILLPILFRRLRSGIATILSVFMLSLGFEIFQLITQLGVCDIDDLILNTSGGIVGYFLFWLVVKLFATHNYKRLAEQ